MKPSSDMMRKALCQPSRVESHSKGPSPKTAPMVPKNKVKPSTSPMFLSLNQTEAILMQPIKPKAEPMPVKSRPRIAIDMLSADAKISPPTEATKEAEPKTKRRGSLSSIMPAGS